MIISWSTHVSWFCTTALICTCKMITESQFDGTLVHALRTICFPRENSLASRCKPINKTWKKLPILWGSKNPFKNLALSLRRQRWNMVKSTLWVVSTFKMLTSAWQAWLPIIAKAWFVNNRAPDTMLTELQTLELVRHCWKGAQTVATRGITSAWITTEVWESAC